MCKRAGGRGAVCRGLGVGVWTKGRSGRFTLAVWPTNAEFWNQALGADPSKGVGVRPYNLE